jgi:predicted amidohydrolase YtcJ
MKAKKFFVTSTVSLIVFACLACDTDSDLTASVEQEIEEHTAVNACTSSDAKFGHGRGHGRGRGHEHGHSFEEQHHGKPGHGHANASHDAPPVTIYKGGKIFTAQPDPKNWWAQAMAVQQGVIVDVGSNEAVMASAPDAARIIDLKGRLVIPGINDAHVHILPQNPLGPQLNDPNTFIPGPGPSVDEVLQLIQSNTTLYPRGTWLYVTVGTRFMEDAAATRFTLDTVSPHHPVVAMAWSGHNMYINTLAMSAMGLSKTAPDPVGGYYDHLAGSNILNGVMHEYAEFDFIRRMKSALSIEETGRQIKYTLDNMRQLGITSIQNMSWIAPSRFEKALDDATLPLRMRNICFPLSLDASRTECDQFANRASDDDRYTFSGVKWLVDGTPIEGLAAFREPYLHSDSRGEFSFPKDVFTEIMEDASQGEGAMGQRLFHALGDRSIDEILTTMSDVQSDKRWKSHRVRIEHGDFILQEHLNDIRKKGIVVVQNPNHFAIGDLYKAQLGEARASNAQPLRSLIDAGIPIAFGSDSIGGMGNPFVDLMFAVLHPYRQSEAISMEEAVIAYTRGAAYAEFKEDAKGTLEADRVADFAVLSQDIFSIPADALPGTKSVLTVVGGEITYDAGVLETTPACIVAANKVNLADRAAVYDSKIAAASLEMGVGANVDGNVFVAGNVFMRGQPHSPSDIHGDLVLKGTLTSQTDANTVDGIITENPNLASPSLTEQHVTSGRKDDRGCNRTLRPGDYRYVDVYSRCKVTLTSGAYNLRAFTLQPDASLVVDTSAGDVFINVSDSFNVGDRTTVETTSQNGRLRVYSNQRYPLRIGVDANFNGHITAPHTDIALQPRADFVGCATAVNIDLQPDAVLEGVFLP